MAPKRDERYTPVTEKLRIEIRRAAMIDGGMLQASMIWNINIRSIHRILNENKLVSLSWLDKFCCVAITELWVSDLPWYDTKELADNGMWENNSSSRFVKKERYCKHCGQRITDPLRRVYCGNACSRASGYVTLTARKRADRIRGVNP